MKVLLHLTLASTLALARISTANPGLEHINAARGANGLPLFQTETHLMDAALNHAEYLARNHTFNHSEEPALPCFTGENHVDRAVYAGYPALSVKENLSKGSGSWQDSAELLMTAIYHRRTFLHFATDEIGFGFAPDETATNTTNIYSYIMGNSYKRRMCEGPSDIEGYYQICSDKDKIVPADIFSKATSMLQNNGPDAAVYPWPDQTEVLPVYLNNETPNPWPGLDLTGMPISVHFNPVRYENSTITIRSFRLTLLSSPEQPVEMLPVRDQASDTQNKIFTKFDFAWFPKYSLALNSSYQVHLTYMINGEEQTKEWQFHTRGQPMEKVLYVSDCEETLYLPERITHTLVLSGNLKDTHIKSVKCRYPKNERCDFRISMLGGVDLAISTSSSIEAVLRNGKSCQIYLNTGT